MREKLQEAARTGLDMSPGDPVAAWADARIAALEARLARVEELARAPLIEGEGAHMQRLVAIRVELGIMPL